MWVLAGFVGMLVTWAWGFGSAWDFRKRPSWVVTNTLFAGHDFKESFWTKKMTGERNKNVFSREKVSWNILENKVLDEISFDPKWFFRQIGLQIGSFGFGCDGFVFASV